MKNSWSSSRNSGVSLPSRLSGDCPVADVPGEFKILARHKISKWPMSLVTERLVSLAKRIKRKITFFNTRDTRVSCARAAVQR